MKRNWARRLDPSNQMLMHWVKIM